MPLVQFVITTATNNSMFTVPISGKCCIKVLNIQYHAANGTSYPVQLRSDSLLLPYSPARYITWINNPSATLNFDNGMVEYNFNNVVLQGQIQLAIVALVTGVEPANFQYCVVSLQIERINENFDIPK